MPVKSEEREDGAVGGIIKGGFYTRSATMFSRAVAPPFIS